MLAPRHTLLRLSMHAIVAAGLCCSSLAQGKTFPDASTQPANPIGAVRATLRGTVTSGANAARVHFEFSSDPSLAGATSTAEQLVEAGSVQLEVTTDIAGLSQATTYYYRVVAEANDGSASGEIIPFNTGFAGKSFPESLTETSARIAERLGVNPQNSKLFSYAEYGKATDVYSSTSNPTLIGLEPGTTYFYRFVSGYVDITQPYPFNTHETRGEWLSLVTAGTADPPRSNVVAEEASDVAATTAVLHGRVFPAGIDAVANFEYRRATFGFGNEGIAHPIGMPVSIPGNLAWMAIATPVEDLPPGTSLAFRVVLEKPDGIIMTPWSDWFVTTPGAPAAETKSASFIAARNAVLNAAFTTGSQDVTFFFEYGTKPDLTEATTTPQATRFASSTLQEYSQAVLDLTPQTAYYYRLVVSNSSSTVRGETRSFVSASANAPELQTLDPSPVGYLSAVLRATVNPHGLPTEVEFFVNGTRRGSLSAGSGFSPVIVEFPVSGLWQPGDMQPKVASTRATNGAGIVDGNSVSFARGVTVLPSVIQTLPPTNITASTATLRASVTSQEDYVRVIFILNGTNVGEQTVPPAWGETIVESPVVTLLPSSDYTVKTVGFGSYAQTNLDGGVVLFTTLRQGDPTDPDTHLKAARFDLILFDEASTEPLPVGRLRLDVTRGGQFTGKIILFRQTSIHRARSMETHPLGGAFGRNLSTMLGFPWSGSGAGRLVLTLIAEGAQGGVELDARIELANRDTGARARGVSAGNNALSAALANKYTLILPMRDASGTSPQGDGFLSGRITAGGRVRFTGQTGSGEPLSFAGLLTKDRTLPIALSTVRHSVYERLTGYLSFQQNLTVGGTFEWAWGQVPFKRVSQPVGAALAPASLWFWPPLGGDDPAATHLRALGADGALLADQWVRFDTSGHARADAQVHLNLDRSTGFFRGDVLLQDKQTRAKFRGVVVPTLRRGSGFLETPQSIGAAELTSH